MIIYMDTMWSLLTIKALISSVKGVHIELRGHGNYDQTPGTKIILMSVNILSGNEQA